MSGIEDEVMMESLQPLMLTVISRKLDYPVAKEPVSFKV